MRSDGFTIWESKALGATQPLLSGIVADIKAVNSGTVLGESFNNVGFDFLEVLTCEAINLSGGDEHPLAGQEAPDPVL